MFTFTECPREFVSLRLDIPLISLLGNHAQHGCINLDYTLQVCIMGDLFIHLETSILNSSQDVSKKRAAFRFLALSTTPYVSLRHAVFLYFGSVLDCRCPKARSPELQAGTLSMVTHLDSITRDDFVFLAHLCSSTKAAPQYFTQHITSFS